MERTMTAEHRLEIEGSVATIVLDRQAQYNALTATLLEALGRTFVELERNGDVRAIVLTGAGKGFCAGQSLDDPAIAAGDGKIDVRTAVASRYNPLLRRMLTIEKPIVAAINGVAAGAGMGLALACDLRLASKAASFTTAFVKIGLVPDSGLSFLLPRIVGYGRAMEAVLLSEKIDAARAYELGIVNRLCEPDDLLSQAQALAAELARGPRAVGLIKRELSRNVFGPGGIDDALSYEAEMQTIAGATEDFTEGVTAFREKRAPRFSGK